MAFAGQYEFGENQLDVLMRMQGHDMKPAHDRSTKGYHRCRKCGRYAHIGGAGLAFQQPCDKG